MAKYELIRTTDTDGLWYSIQIDGLHVNNSYTRHITEAEEMLKKLVNGELQGKAIVETIKTIETNEENKTN